MRRNLLTICLVISVAINLALAGYLVGARMHAAPVLDPTRSFKHWTQTLPEERRRELRKLQREQRREGRGALRELLQHNDSMRSAIAAQPFSEEQLRSALADLRTHASAAQTRSHEAFIELVAELTPDERQQLARDLGNPRELRRLRGLHRQRPHGPLHPPPHIAPGQAAPDQVPVGPDNPPQDAASGR